MTFNIEQIEQFDPTVEQLHGIIAEVKARMGDKPNDPKVIKDARISLKNARVAITKKGKELREEALDFHRKVISREKELIAIIEPEEDRLQAIEDEAKKEIEMIKRKAVLPQLIQKLESIGDGFSNEEEYILTLDDDEFDKYYNLRVSNKNEADRKKLEEEKQKIEYEKKELIRKQEIKEAEERARKEEKEKQEEDERKRVEYEKGEKERIAKEKKNYRINRLVELGLNRINNNFVGEGFSMSIEEVEYVTDYEFDVFVQKITIEVAKRTEAARIQKEMREKQPQVEKDQKEAAEKLEKERQEEIARMEEEDRRIKAQEAYQNFLSKNGFINDDTFKIEKVDNTVFLYKLVDSYEIK